MKEGDFQWALELADYLKWMGKAERESARDIKISALRSLAAQEYNAPNRNYYLSYAIELVEEQTTDAYVVAIHRGSTDPGNSYYDPYNFFIPEARPILLRCTSEFEIASSRLALGACSFFVTGCLIVAQHSLRSK